jgi:hypothetical protein
MDISIWTAAAIVRTIGSGLKNRRRNQSLRREYAGQDVPAFSNMHANPLPGRGSAAARHCVNCNGMHCA